MAPASSDGTHSEQKQKELHNRLSSNAVAMVLSNLFYFIVRVGIPPFVLRYVSLEEYGLWSYSFLIIGYVSMSVFGIINVYVRFGAIYAAQHQWESINKLYSTGVLLSSFIFCTALGCAWYLLPLLFPYFHIPSELQETAFVLMFGTLVIFCFDLIFGVFIGFVQGLQQLTTERAILSISYAIETVLILLLLWSGVGITSLLIAYAARVLVVILLARWKLFQLMPTLHFSRRFVDWSITRLFWNYGSIVQLSGFIGVFNRTVERLLSGLSMGSAATALYDLGTKFPSTALLIPGSINGIFLPTVAHLCAEERMEEIRLIYLKGSRAIHIVAAGMMAFLVMFAHPIVTAWLGHKPYLEVIAQILMLFAIAYQIEVVTGPASAIYRGINRPKRELLYGGVRLLLLSLVAPIVFFYWGTSMTTINTVTVSTAITAAIFYFWISNRFFEIPQHLFFKEVLLPGLWPYLCALVLAWGSASWIASLHDSRFAIIGALFILLCLYILICFLVLFLLVLTDKERQIVKAQLMRLRSSGG